MTNWHNDNPIMTTHAAVAMDDIVAYLTGNNDKYQHRDLRIDSTGRMFTRPTDAAAGVVTYSDTPRNFDLDQGVPAEYFRNYFGAIVREA